MQRVFSPAPVILPEEVARRLGSERGCHGPTVSVPQLQEPVMPFVFTDLTQHIGTITFHHPSKQNCLS
jgi:hypothetical protein